MTELYGPSGWERLLRQFFEDEGAVRVLLGDGWDVILRDPVRCFKEAVVLAQSVRILVQWRRILLLSANEGAEDSSPLYESVVWSRSRA
jgi:hypothetical protein